MAKQKGSSKETVVGRITIWLLKLLIAFFVLSLAGVLFYRFVPVYYTPLMFIRMYEQHSRGEKTRLDHQWVPIDKISPNVPLAAVAGEDAKFLDHNGFDEKA
ncbi:MAG: transglycosylase domain-containing protein, partial [Paludibacteraceae bacterium]|nr:transglycosylase domain-containing protein [Paludibacteraceae bacterium]